MAVITVDPAPTKEAITGSLSRSWASWFNQIYAAVSSLIATVAGIQTGGTLTNPTLAGTVALGAGWQNWTPAVNASGSMSVLVTSFTTQQYVRFGPWVFFEVVLSVTTSGTASTYVWLTPPVAAVGSFSSTIANLNLSGSAWTPAVGFLDSANGRLRVELAAAANFPIGSFALATSGFYRCA